MGFTNLCLQLVPCQAVNNQHKTNSVSSFGDFVLLYFGNSIFNFFCVFLHCDSCIFIIWLTWDFMEFLYLPLCVSMSACICCDFSLVILYSWFIYFTLLSFVCLYFMFLDDCLFYNDREQDQMLILVEREVGRILKNMGR